MTTPVQRYRAIVQQQMLLVEIAKQSKKQENGDFIVPADLMHRIYPSLKHAVIMFDLDRISEKCPGILEKPEQAIHLPVRRG